MLDECDAPDNPAIPVAGTASVVVGIDLFLSTFRPVINMIGKRSGNC